MGPRWRHHFEKTPKAIVILSAPPCDARLYSTSAMKQLLILAAVLVTAVAAAPKVKLDFYGAWRPFSVYYPVI